MPFDIVSIGLALVLGWWTTRLARNKGRRAAWIWGAAAFLLTIPPAPWRLIGMLPLLALLFMRNPVPQAEAPPKESVCARCNATHPAGHRYCVACGWELARSYPETPANQTLDASTEASTPAVTEEPAEPAVSAPAGVSPQETQAAADPAPSESPEPVLASQPVEEAVVAEQTPEAEPVPETPVFRGQPTAANMTERGIWLFNQGRIQESIDQFTKALALDVNFKEAWEHRAEAYSRLGRGEQAAEDRRRLQAINAGSSSS